MAANASIPTIPGWTYNMRQFVIDELNPMELGNIDSWLKRNMRQGEMEGLYWLELLEEHLDEAQKGAEHAEHGPWYMAIEVTRNEVRFELLVRSRNNLHCSCIAQATPMQRQFMLDTIDRLVKEEMITA